MYFKEQRFEKAKASSLADVHKVELPESGILDSISLYFRVTTANPPTVFPCNLHHHITKVEVIGDNDKTLYSLSGEQAIAKAYRKMGALPPIKQNEYNGVAQDLLIPIFFGRHFRDIDYALDLAQWDKVEVQVTNDITTGTFTNSLSMETRLTTQEEAVRIPAKFLKQWQYDSRAASAAGEYLRPKLPTKGKLRTLMIQLDPTITTSTGGLTGGDPLGDAYIWKLWFKDRALTIFEHRPRDIMRDEHRRMGVGVSQLKFPASTTIYRDFHWGEVLGVALGATGDSGDTTVPSLEDSRDRYQKQGFAGTPTMVQAIVHGLGLFHTFEIPWYVKDTEDEYLDLSTVSPVEIEHYASDYRYTHKTILEKPIGQGAAEFA